jgi:DNA-directed RNA polymerase subunit E'/Rpb7
VIGSAAVFRPFEIEAVEGGTFQTAKKGVRFGLGIDSPGETLMARIKLRKEFHPNA